VIEQQGIYQQFSSNGVRALDGADFSASGAEIHALLGENGAGKSTLMHVLAGYLSPDAGQVSVDGRRYRFSIPAAALKAGIGMVRQYPHLTPGWSVWEDCTVGAEPGFVLHRKRARRRVQDFVDRWGFALPVDAPVDTLTISQRQKVAILALLLRQVRYLIFDEPTAVLSPPETEQLFALFRSLKAEGAGIILISHKLDETLRLADRVTVLRHGKTVATGTAQSFTRESLNEYLFGVLPEKERPGTKPVPGQPVLSVCDLSVEAPGYPFLRKVNLKVSAGTVLGIAGVRDSGLETLERAVTGRLPSSAGTVVLAGTDITGRGIPLFRRAGGAYLTADGSAAASALSLFDTLLIHLHRRALSGWLGKIGIMDRRFLVRRLSALMAAAGVVRPFTARTDSCSGGMLQRLVLSRELAENARVLVLSEPGRGLDRKSREELANRLHAYIMQAHMPAVLLFSTDLDELAGVADEIAVLYNGAIVDRIVCVSDTERIVRAMTGSVL
jgi:simple sugar transport system ATP-binding protein